MEPSSAALAEREGAAAVNELAAVLSARAPVMTTDVSFFKLKCILFTLLSD